MTDEQRGIDKRHVRMHIRRVNRLLIIFGLLITAAFVESAIGIRQHQQLDAQRRRDLFRTDQAVCRSLLDRNVVLNGHLIDDRAERANLVELLRVLSATRRAEATAFAAFTPAPEARRGDALRHLVKVYRRAAASDALFARQEADIHLRLLDRPDCLKRTFGH